MANKTYDEWLLTVRWSGLELESVPEEFKDRKMCLTAVEAWGGALEFVPYNLRDLEMCKASFAGAGEQPKMSCVPKEHWEACLDYKLSLAYETEQLEGW
jgi:hypothetical protein